MSGLRNGTGSQRAYIYGVLLGVLWIGPGCASRMVALEDAPIRVKNQKLEVELLTGDPADVWAPDGDDFTPSKSGHAKTDTIKVFASKYGGDLCPVFQPYKAKTVTLEYGPTTGNPTKTVTVKVRMKKVKVNFRGAKGGTKTLEYGGGPSDFLRLVRAEYPGARPITCKPAAPSDNMVVTLY